MSSGRKRSRKTCPCCGTWPHSPSKKEKCPASRPKRGKTESAVSAKQPPIMYENFHDYLSTCEEQRTTPTSDTDPSQSVDSSHDTSQSAENTRDTLQSAESSHDTLQLAESLRDHWLPPKKAKSTVNKKAKGLFQPSEVELKCTHCGYEFERKSKGYKRVSLHSKRYSIGGQPEVHYSPAEILQQHFNVEIPPLELERTQRLSLCEKCTRNLKIICDSARKLKEARTSFVEAACSKRYIGYKVVDERNKAQEQASSAGNGKKAQGQASGTNVRCRKKQKKVQLTGKGDVAQTSGGERQNEAGSNPQMKKGRARGGQSQHPVVATGLPPAPVPDLPRQYGLATVVADIRRGLYFRGLNKLINKSVAGSRDFLLVVTQHVRKEKKKLGRGPSTLRMSVNDGGDNQETLANFKWNAVNKELKRKCPILHAALKGATTDVYQKHKNITKEALEERKQSGKLCRGVITALLAYHINPQWNTKFQKLTSQMMWAVTGSNEIYKEFCRLGWCQGITATRHAARQLGIPSVGRVYVKRESKGQVVVKAKGEVADADKAKGDVADADKAKGDVADADKAKGEVADADKAKGDVADADKAKGDVAGADKSEGEAAVKSKEKVAVKSNAKAAKRSKGKPADRSKGKPADADKSDEKPADADKSEGEAADKKNTPGAYKKDKGKKKAPAKKKMPAKKKTPAKKKAPAKKKTPAKKKMPTKKTTDSVEVRQNLSEPESVHEDVENGEPETSFILQQEDVPHTLSRPPDEDDLDTSEFDGQIGELFAQITQNLIQKQMFISLLLLE